MGTALLLERTSTTSGWADWETPAGGPPPLPRFAGMSFTCVAADDPHLQGQPCLAIEPTRLGSDTCLVAFACGCRAQVARKALRPR
jgi:hypothetical protein